MFCVSGGNRGNALRYFPIPPGPPFSPAAHSNAHEDKVRPCAMSRARTRAIRAHACTRQLRKSNLALKVVAVAQLLSTTAASLTTDNRECYHLSNTVQGKNRLHGKRRLKDSICLLRCLTTFSVILFSKSQFPCKGMCKYRGTQKSL